MNFSAIKKEARDFFSGFVGVGVTDMMPGFIIAPSESGVAVTEMTAIQVAAVSACLRVLSTSLGMLPVGVYQRVAGGANPAPDHPVDSVLRLSPNEEYSAADLWMVAEIHRNMTGNAYVEIVRDDGARPRELWLRNPWRTFPYRDLKTMALIYKTSDTPDGKERIIDPMNMLHIKGTIGIDPWVGMSPVRTYMREVFGGGIAAQNSGNRFWRNNSRPDGVLSTPDVLDKDRRLQTAQEWEAAHGRGGQHRVAILDGGLKWETIGMNPEEAQFIQTRGMLRSEIAGMYGVPAHFIGEQAVDRSANLEQKFLEFLTMTLAPTIRRYEDEINRKLFNASVGRAAGKYFVKFDDSAFRQADFETTLKALQTGRFSGLINIDEGRKMLHLNPVDPKTLKATNPGGALWQPVNMVPITDGVIEEPSKGLPDVGVQDGQKQLTDGTNPPKSPAEPEQPKAETKSLIPVFFNQMKDGISRLSARNKVNEDDFQRVLMPVLAGIGSTYAPMNESFILPLDVAGAIRTHIRSIYERSSKWDKNDLSKVATDELTLALDAIIPIAKRAAEPEVNKKDKEDSNG